jgi:YHS domain-containing protein
MKPIVQAILIMTLLSAPALAADLVNVSGASRVALDGYDPVAFFTDSKPVNGSPFIKTTYRGADYFFTTEEHKKLFIGSPEKYAPQYGGYCAFGVGINSIFPVDIDTWQIRDGKLYLNLNHDILEKFNADFEGNVAKAERNWPGLVQKSGR